MSAEKLRNVAKIPGMVELVGTLGVELLNDIADSYSDMYKALKKAHKELDDSGAWDMYEGVCDAMDVLKQALAKAEGKE